jgi:hypothetical protein
MGAYYQSATINAKDEKELKEKYRDLVEQCRWESGHGGYSGTFAEKWDLRIIRGAFGREEAEGHCEDKNDKWGPSYAYDLGDGLWYVGGWCSS